MLSILWYSRELCASNFITTDWTWPFSILTWQCLCAGPSLVGWKVGDDYRGPRQRGAPRRSELTGWGQPKKTLRTVDGPLLRMQRAASHRQQDRTKLCLKSFEHRICLFLLLYRHIQDYVKIPVLESILEKPVGYVLSQSNQLRKKLDVHHYTGCIVS